MGPCLMRPAAPGLSDDSLEALIGGVEETDGVDSLWVGGYAFADTFLVEADMGEGLPFENDAFVGFTCLGAFGPGHAPPESLIHLSRVTRSGGIGVFNLLDATWIEQGFQSVLESLVWPEPSLPPSTLRSARKPLRKPLKRGATIFTMVPDGIVRVCGKP